MTTALIVIAAFAACFGLGAAAAAIVLRAIARSPIQPGEYSGLDRRDGLNEGVNR